MPGVNRFFSTAGLKAEMRSSASTSTGTCVFISYRKVDQDAANVIAHYLKFDVGVDIYFDEQDTELEAAVAANSDKGIVECLERGLDFSTHLLGVLSPNTKDSWWVPFEIGSARRKKAEVGYILIKDVDDLPSYLKIATLVKNQDELKNWARSLKEVYLWERKAYEPAPKVPGLPSVRASVRFR